LRPKKNQTTLHKLGALGKLMAQQETRDRLLNKHYWQKKKIKKPGLFTAR
jgi:hypothetical protein